MEYPWYESISFSNTILQGDFIPECPIIIPPLKFDQEEESLNVQLQNAIVMSQSCDLENGKAQIVLVCPHYNLSEFLKQHPTSKDGGKGIQTVKENLKKGNYPAYHLLKKEESNDILDFVVVDFRNVYGVHYDYLKVYLVEIEKRVRLLPPYREHLSQAFARYFMRVGLPINIDV